MDLAPLFLAGRKLIVKKKILNFLLWKSAGHPEWSRFWGAYASRVWVVASCDDKLFGKGIGKIVSATAPKPARGTRMLPNPESALGNKH